MSSHHRCCCGCGNDGEDLLLPCQLNTTGVPSDYPGVVTVTKALTTGVMDGDSGPINGTLEMPAFSFLYGIDDPVAMSHACNLLRPYDSPGVPAPGDYSAQQTQGSDFYSLDQRVSFGLSVNGVATGPSQHLFPTNIQFPFIVIPLGFRTINICRYNPPGTVQAIAISDVVTFFKLLINRDGEVEIFVEGNYEHPNSSTEAYNTYVRSFVLGSPAIQFGVGAFTREELGRFSTYNVGTPVVSINGNCTNGFVVDVSMPSLSTTMVVQAGPLIGTSLSFDGSAEFAYTISPEMFTPNPYFIPSGPPLALASGGAPESMRQGANFQQGGCCEGDMMA